MDKILDIWNDFKAQFFQGGLSRISYLLMEASSLNPGDLSITEYSIKLRIIWDELENFRLDPFCTCHNKCSCNVYFVIYQRKKRIPGYTISLRSK